MGRPKYNLSVARYSVGGEGWGRGRLGGVLKVVTTGKKERNHNYGDSLAFCGVTFSVLTRHPTIVCGLLAWIKTKSKITAQEGPGLSYIPSMLPRGRDSKALEESGKQRNGPLGGKREQ
jgi:hypothetical protein